MNAGYGFSDSNNTTFGSGLTAIGPAFQTPVTGVFTGPGGNRNNDGFVGGGQVGYNYQFGQFVVGLEGDIQYTDFGRGRGSQSTFGTAVPNFNIFPSGGAPNVAFFNSSRKSDFFGTVRGRVGYTFDRVLVYGTGGLAIRDLEDTRNNTFPVGFFVPGAGTTIATTRRGDDLGYAVGGGVEYAFTPSLTAKIEGLYVDFGRGPNNIVGVTNTGAPIVSTSSGTRNDDFAVVRAGINYKFNLF